MTGKTLVGDIIDAMAGYNAAEIERVKSLIEIVRTSTSILFNIQVDKKYKMTARELWPLPWDVKKTTAAGKVTNEAKEALYAMHEKILNEMGNG